MLEKMKEIIAEQLAVEEDVLSLETSFKEACEQILWIYSNQDLWKRI